ncbi:glycerol-3-phosphate acyltransferase 3-like isoform X2 [Chironomus tepperi]|uniref:glycerol-3-phosphate acyltransferase 3-like isoform X2 n=1 Tax=Chironomus tepperi TaxID=113505 RepID=UPI00391F648E
MAILEIASGILFAPFFCILFLIILLASFGKSFGIRRLYVELLVKLFEYGRANIESAIKRKDSSSDCASDSEDETDHDKEKSVDHVVDNLEIPKKNGLIKKVSSNGNIGNGNGNSVISKESLILVPDKTISANVNQSNDKESPILQNNNNDEQIISDKDSKLNDFKLDDCLEYVKSGMEAIIEDDVTSRFQAEELKNWNLLTRTNRGYEFISWRLTVLWVIGFLIRYLFLMPLRVIICFIGVGWMVVAFTLVGFIPFEDLRIWMNNKVSLVAHRIIIRSLSASIVVHNEEYQPKSCGFCVANHTSPIDVAILSADCTYSLIGQRHGGFLGILQRALGRASPHIWFERAEAKDRSAVAARLRQHVSDPKNPPILIFPEGTCINNTSVMQFKKGSFEVGGVIYPVAIKYDARFGDAFWNSSKDSMLQYLYMMMTSWAIVCDVWYLPPMYREEGESAIDFANRVKSVIAKQGGLIDLVWDGQLKRMKAKKEWKEIQQEKFAERLKGD